MGTKQVLNYLAKHDHAYLVVADGIDGYEAGAWLVDRATGRDDKVGGVVAQRVRKDASIEFLGGSIGVRHYGLRHDIRRYRALREASK